MPQEEINIVQQILGLGLSGVLLVGIFILWRAYQQLLREYIEDLQRIAALKQQQEQIQSVVETWKNKQSGHEGSGI